VVASEHFPRSPSVSAAPPWGSGSGDAVDAGALLALLISRPAWMSDALCRERPDVSFFPKRGEDASAAKAVCAACLVRAECLDFAMRRDDLGSHGVWGGTSPRERARLRRQAG
jgi:WhiB family redox-sensing transcriptional regulator